MDVLRPPASDDFSTRNWRVVDQALPVPFQLGSSTLNQASFIPSVDSLGGTMAPFANLLPSRAYHDAGGFDPSQVSTDSRPDRAIGVEYRLGAHYPGCTLLSNAKRGLDGFINSVSDIKLFFQTYSYAGE